MIATSFQKSQFNRIYPVYTLQYTHRHTHTHRTSFKLKWSAVTKIGRTELTVMTELSFLERASFSLTKQNLSATSNSSSTP